jgi:hypothetical protein
VRTLTPASDRPPPGTSGDPRPSRDLPPVIPLSAFSNDSRIEPSNGRASLDATIRPSTPITSRIPVRALCGIAYARGSHTRTGLGDRAGLSQARTSRQCAPACTSLCARKRDSECGLRQRGNGRGNPGGPCGIVLFLFSDVNPSIGACLRGQANGS